MAHDIKITLPCEPFSEQLVTFTALCDCSEVKNGLIINGQTYTICDAMGNCVTGRGGTWKAGAKICVMLDCENKKAYIQNGNTTPATIGAAPNHNLLDNWYFKNAVNQRGKTSYTDVGYTLDRWAAKRATAITSLDFSMAASGAGLVFTNNSTGGSVYCEQTFEDALPPGEYTLSILVTNLTGTAYIGFYKSSGGAVKYKAISGEGVTSLTYTITAADTARAVRITAQTGASVTVDAIKLERGDTQTLAHRDSSGKWLLNEIPNYNIELLKCCMSTADSTDEYANNKKTAAVVGAVSKSGDKMNGNLIIEKTYPLVALNDTTGFGGAVQTFSNMLGLFSLSDHAASSNGDYRRLNIYNPTGKTSLDEALSISDKVGNKVNTYPILHTGNMDTYLSGVTKIATGSYEGTGTYGIGNMNTITVDFKPRMMIIGSTGSTAIFIVAYGMNSSGTYIHLWWGENNVSWYGESANTQWNTEGSTYYWSIIGE